MRNQQFTGTFGGNVGTNVLNPSQGRDPFLEPTPAPKPQHATRTGRTFAGTVSARLPRAANENPGFGQMNLPVGGGRERFGRLGRRAGDEAVENYNAEATTWNEQQAAAKAAEVSAYESEVNRLNSTYTNSVNTYNGQVTTFNNESANASGFYNQYRDTFTQMRDAYAAAEAAVQRNDQHNTSYWNGYANNIRYSILPGYQANWLVNKPHKDYGVPNYIYEDGYDGTTASGPQPGFTAPTRPTLPGAPDPTFDQRLMKEELPDLPGDRRLAGNQREILGGDLPPQEASLTGDSFGQAPITYGNIPNRELRQLSQINAVEKKSLGNPVAYTIPASTRIRGAVFSTAPLQPNAGIYQSGIERQLSPDQINNETDTHFHFLGLGWIAKSDLTPLY